MSDFNVPLRRGETLDLSGDFGRALGLISSTRDSYFVTGKAGTGKSTLLRHFSDTTKKPHVLLAPTGIAAVNIGGETIHSFFRFPPEPITQSHIHFSARRELYKAIETLVIDEVSMVRADLMDGIDMMLRLNREQPSVPFGGVQLLLFGDIFQLEPVVATREEAQYFSSYYRSPYFFSAKVFEETPFSIIDMQTVFRQRDASFIDLLDAVRTNRLTPSHLSKLNSRHCPELAAQLPDQAVTLTSTNQQAFDLNSARLRQLPPPEHSYYGVLEGEFTRRALPAEIILTLRAGAQVMFVKNDMNRRWVNGTIGKVASLADDVISVDITNRDGAFHHDVGRATWETRKYRFDPATRSIQSETVGTYTQFPLKLAWAITIHKSQGLTFDELAVDFGAGAFAHGQAYVALSRCTSLSGLALRTPLRASDVKISPDALRFYQERVFRPA